MQKIQYHHLTHCMRVSLLYHAVEISLAEFACHKNIFTLLQGSFVVTF